MAGVCDARVSDKDGLRGSWKVWGETLCSASPLSNHTPAGGISELLNSQRSLVFSLAHVQCWFGYSGLVIGQKYKGSWSLFW